MTISLGLDIGSNSVGSAWADTEKREILTGVSHFPAGVDETDAKRGPPKNQHRREKRSQRKNLARRAARKSHLRALLTSAGLLPSDGLEWMTLMAMDPWALRRKALTATLTKHEFGRVLVHLNQRRGAVGVHIDSDDESNKEVTEETPENAKAKKKSAKKDDEKPVKEAIERLSQAMKETGAKTFGKFMADRMDERRRPVPGKEGKFYHDPIRNRRETFEFHATRDLIQNEFHTLWDEQKKRDGELAGLLTDELRKQLNDEKPDDTWRQKGIIFGQRRTYWDTGTLGRCDLEPSDRCCPLADMHAQEFRVLETVNNIRISEGGSQPRPLDGKERARVKKALQSKKTGYVATVRKALGIDKATLKKKDLPDIYHLNLEADPDREINTDWFYREIVLGVFTEDLWLEMDMARRESVNRAVLKFDPDSPSDAERLRNGAMQWWGLSPDAADKLVRAWKRRPKLEKRMNLSRQAILNLLPYMRDVGCGVTVARQLFAEDGDNDATPQQRNRYAFGGSGLTKSNRHFLRKHPDLLPPAPMLANPVVRKAIHEVRSHVLAYLRKFGQKPDRVVIELAREAKQSAKVRNKILSANRVREKEKKSIIEDFNLAALPLNQQSAAVERVLLCRQQRGLCPYTNKMITEPTAKEGRDVEVDHIVPESRSHDNGMNNKVLCYRQANRGKGNKTPKEWLTPEQFSQVEQHMAHWEKGFPQKWKNLHRDPQDRDAFLNSQLTDTAYAAVQVGEYLREALYGHERDGKCRVFFTKGSYTAMLRKDWQLFQTLPRPADSAPAGGEADPPERRSAGRKNRGDHRQHAIDAVVIALTGPDIVEDVARLAAEREDYHEQTGYWPKREPLPPPWGTPAEFRRQILSQIFDEFDTANVDGTKDEGAETGKTLVVSHRAVKRKVVGAFHEETAYGPVIEKAGSISKTQFTSKIRAVDLEPNHLRMPKGAEEIEKRLCQQDLTVTQRRKAWRELLGMRDAPPAKSGIVRDMSLRAQIRQCLRNNGIDPDDISTWHETVSNKLKKFEKFRKLVLAGKLHLPSGVPIKGAVLLRTISDPVVMPRKVYDPKAGKRVADPDPRTSRVYIGGNNHHIEVREDVKTGRWSGEVVTMFEAARRVRDKNDPVDRSGHEGERFVMSLAEGEAVRMRHPETRQPGYFVVFKLDKPQTVHFIHHWDARPSKESDDMEAREDVGRGLTPNNLKELGVEPGKPPFKVRVDPLGQVTPVYHD